MLPVEGADEVLRNWGGYENGLHPISVTIYSVVVMEWFVAAVGSVMRGLAKYRNSNFRLKKKYRENQLSSKTFSLCVNLNLKSHVVVS